MAMLRKAKDRIRAVQGEIESRRHTYRQQQPSSSRGKSSGRKQPPRLPPPRVSLKSIANSQDDSFEKILDELDSEGVSNPLFADEFESSGECSGPPTSVTDARYPEAKGPSLIRPSVIRGDGGSRRVAADLFEDDGRDQLFDPLMGGTVESSHETDSPVPPI